MKLNTSSADVSHKKPPFPGRLLMWNAFHPLSITTAAETKLYKVHVDQERLNEFIIVFVFFFFINFFKFIRIITNI